MSRYHRTHYLDGWPSSVPNDPEPKILCGESDPDDWDADEAAVTCPDCLLAMGETYGAHKHRKPEIDRWLQEIGARVIRVESLEAALEALTYHLIFAPKGQEFDLNTYADRGSHLARLALGEG